MRSVTWRNIQVCIVHILIMGLPIVAAFATDWWIGWKLIMALTIFGAEFFIALLGRDFFDVYVGRSFLAVAVLYLVALVSAGILYKFGSAGSSTTPELDRQASSGARPFAERIVATPGTLFSLFAATITAVGFTVTILRLQESHVRISHYDRFLLRLERLLRITLQIHGQSASPIDRWEGFFKRSARLLGSRRDGLRIICTVPTLGNMSHHDLYIERVHKLWRQVANCEALPVQIVCVDATDSRLASVGASWSAIEPSEKNGVYEYGVEDFFPPPPEKSAARNKVRSETPVGKFYDGFRKRDFQDYEIIRGMTEAVEIIRKFNDSKKGNSIISYEWPLPGIEGETPTKEPHFHLFWTRRRAIVAMPLDRNLPRKMMQQQVTMIGYETTDADVIERLLQVYVEYTGMLKSNRIGSGQTISFNSI